MLRSPSDSHLVLRYSTLRKTDFSIFPEVTTAQIKRTNFILLLRASLLRGDQGEGVLPIQRSAEGTSPVFHSFTCHAFSRDGENHQLSFQFTCALWSSKSKVSNTSLLFFLLHPLYNVCRALFPHLSSHIITTQPSIDPIR